MSIIIFETPEAAGGARIIAPLPSACLMLFCYAEVDCGIASTCRLRVAADFLAVPVLPMLSTSASLLVQAAASVLLHLRAEPQPLTVLPNGLQVSLPVALLTAMPGIRG